MAENNGIKKVSDLDPTKVQAAVDKFGVDTVNKTLTDRGIEGAKEVPTPPTEEPAITETKVTEVGGIPGVTAEPVIPQEEIKKEKPAPTKEIKKEEPKIEPTVITSLSEFKSAGSNLDNLVNFLENSPREQTEDVQIVGNKVTGTRNGERFEWKIDGAGNPIRKSLGIKDNEKETFAKNAGIAFDVDNKGGVIFNPSNFDEALDIINQFGTAAKFKPGSREAITGTAVFKKYSKYKGASSDVYLEGLKSNEIATGGETWNRLIKMNGGEPTEAMLMAAAEYEKVITTDAINTNSAELYKSFGGKITETGVSKTDETLTSLEKLDKDYLATKVNMFENIETQYANYKKGTEATNDLRKSAQDTASQIDELNVEKRKILKGVKKRFPQLPLSAQLKIARDETEAVDDELFALQRTYSNQMADYQYADTQDKAEFEFNMKMLDQKNSLIDTLYGTTRGDVIRAEDIERQDKLLADQIARQEEARKQAIIDGDTTLAKQMTYNLKLAEEKLKLNNEYGLKTFGNRAMKWNKDTGEWEEISEPTETDTTSFIAEQEGFRDTAYQDSAGVWTIGYGTTRINGQPIKKGDTISQEEAQGLLNEDIERHSNWRNGIKVDLTPSQEAALASFEYNLGTHIWSKGAGNILDMINEGDIQGAATEMLKYNKARDTKTGELNVLNGLTNRRQREADLLLGANFEEEEGDDLYGAADLQELSDAMSLIESKSGLKDLEKQFGEEAGGRIRDARNALKNSIESWSKEDPVVAELINTYNDNFSSSKVSDEERPIVRDRFLKALRDKNPEGIKQAIRLQFFKGEKGDELTGGIQVLEDLDVIKSAFENLPAGKETGPILNMLNFSNRKLGISYTPDATVIEVGVGAILADYIKEISGAAVTDVEREFLSRQIPSLNDNPQRFGIVLDTFRDKIRRRSSAGSRANLRKIDGAEVDFYELFPEYKLPEITEISNKEAIRSEINAVADRATDSILQRNP